MKNQNLIWVMEGGLKNRKNRRSWLFSQVESLTAKGRSWWTDPRNEKRICDLIRNLAENGYRGKAQELINKAREYMPD